MVFDPRRAARDIGRDAATGAKWTAHTLSSASAWRRAGRSLKHSFVGSLINQLVAILIVALAFAGFWLNDRFNVPEVALYAAGGGALCMAAWLNRRLWRGYTRSWTGRPSVGASRRSRNARRHARSSP